MVGVLISDVGSPDGDATPAVLLPGWIISAKLLSFERLTQPGIGARLLQETGFLEGIRNASRVIAIRFATLPLAA
jgi:hypothetical protein